MKVVSRLEDKRINSINILVEIDASDYVSIAKNILSNNEFQRRRVKNSGTIYSLLKADILRGCLIPPIVLASKVDSVPNISEIGEEFVIRNIFSAPQNLIILDGLQRTHSLIEVFNESPVTFAGLGYVIRLEIYLNLSETGILYRMLTLNAGQTPMSLRHQIEILYSNFADKKIGEIRIIRQIDEESKKSHKDYNYSDLIEGYNSYLERNESPIDRYSLLDIVQSIGTISADSLDKNSFSQFAKTHFTFLDKLQQESRNWEFPDQAELPPEFRLQNLPFGATPYKIFNRTQSLTGFGAAVGSLVEQKILASISDLDEIVESIRLDNITESLLMINKCLDEVRQDAKKIGNAQRLFFRYFFRGYFDRSQSDLFLNFQASTLNAKQRTLSNM